MSEAFEGSTAAALSALEEGSAEDAFELLKPALEYPGWLDGPDDWATTLALLERITAALGQAKLQACAAAARGGAPDGLHRLGSALIGARLPALAATVLARALQQAPADEAILAELAAALELLGRYADSRRHLAAANPTGFLPRYLLAFATLMCGDIEETRRLVAALAPRTEQDVFMRTRLTGMLARVDAVRGVTPLDATDRRGWHFVLTGGFLLHQGASSDGMVMDTEALCHAGLVRLAATAEALQLSIPRVLAFENPESRRLGAAAGALLGVPVVNVYLPEAPGLFVAYDLANLIGEVLGGLRTRVAGLTVFSHAAQTRREQSLAADFTTIHYGLIRSPWFGRPPAPPDADSDTVLGRRIVETELPTDALTDLPDLLALAAAGRALASACRQDGVRERQWVRPSL